ncbi:AI-2E family transporter [Haloplasma contractile]|uniref:Membrane protein putative n=1 Tax=Haloplasma contractile SSD-17B TaxID=1033810 RepID=U2EGH1_9MOLU|nr:AI-2E family transporter [Haloplasma contractile]ERJ13711.1 Membrane protein putative [Haloplasma contractile SSD-17B]
MKVDNRYIKLIVSLVIISLFFIIIILGHIALPIIYKIMVGFFHVLLPFIISFFIAFLLHTIVDRLEMQGLNRAISVLFVYLAFTLLLTYGISNLIPIIINQVIDLTQQLPTIYDNLKVTLDDFWLRNDFIPEKYQFNIKDLESWTMGALEKIRLNSTGVNGILDSFNIIILTPIITFYFLYDYNRIKSGLGKFLLKHKYNIIYKFLKDVDVDLGSYFRGLILVMNLLAIAATIGFSIIGLDYPFLFGFIVGYTNVIPIIGLYIGGIPAVLYAFTSSYKLAILATIVIVVSQALESNIVTPYVQSKSINAHPLLILLAFVVFSRYFGIMGMIFAIPILAIILLVFRYIKSWRRLQRVRKCNCNVEKSKTIYYN